MRGWRKLATLVLLAAVGSVPPGAQASELARADAAWASRAEGEVDGQPSPEAALEAVSAYERALAAEPESLELRWKLLRALHFAGDFAPAGEREAFRAFERGLEVAEEGLDALTRRVGAGGRLETLDPATLASRLEAAGVAPSPVARLYFWSAVHWGGWSRRVGLLGAVRQGVANRLFEYTNVTLALEPGYEEGGPLRLLGRLHAELPRVPFVSGWVDRDRALPLVERAYALAPANPGNRLLLALTILDLAPGRRAEALDLLRRVAGLEPRPSMRIEDLTVREMAREVLVTVRAEDAA